MMIPLKMPTKIIFVQMMIMKLILLDLIILTKKVFLQSSLSLAPDSSPQFLSQLLPQNQIQNQEKMDIDSDLNFHKPLQKNNILFEKSSLIKKTVRKPI